VILTFRRSTGSTSTTVVFITCVGGTQSIINQINSGATTQGFLPNSTYINRITSLYNGSSYNWYFT
jgi:hypothetical protein